MRTMPAAFALLVCACVVRCAVALVPTYSVQVVPDPPVGAGAGDIQRDLKAVLPDGRFVVLNMYNGEGGGYFIGTEGDWHRFAALPGDVDAAPTVFSSNGLIAGWSRNASGLTRPVTWTAAGVVELSSEFGDRSGARGINRHGVVTGVTYDPATGSHLAWTWNNGVVTHLATPPGYSCAEASQTNALGVTAGLTPGNQAPVVWSGGVPTVLPVPDGDIFYATVDGINDDGWVVGVREYHAGTDGTYLWRNGAYELLRASSMPTWAQVSNTGDVLISDLDTEHLWRDGVIYHNGDLLTPGFDGSVIWTQTLLDDGRILGKVEVDGVVRNAVLTPIPAPGPLGLVVAAGVACGWRRRR